MNEYKLDAHLNALCREHTEYANLYSTWSLNKHICTEILKSVVIHYPHFSMHDVSHAEAVVSKIEMILGNRIQNLSPTDTWLLLHAAYAHDLGMALRWEHIQSIWESSEFQDFLSSLNNSPDKEIREAAIFIRDIGNANTASSWPLKAHRYVSLINAQYFRTHHARLSNTYIQTTAADLGLDLGHSNLIQPRILKILGKICELHTAPLSEILTLDYQTDGVRSDYAHPRFVLMFLRLGDLLDIDNGRFNTACESAFGGIPESSISHKEKHEATTHLLVTPTEIQFRSDCPNSQAYLETRNFVTWLEDEVDFLTKYWSKIAPVELGGYAPHFDKKELLINGTPDIEGVAGLRFEISQEKAFQIIEGSNIYEDRFVFIRELIQNAMDASKIQLWRDLASGNYHAWTGEKNLDALQPFDLDRKIYESYPINIQLSTLPDGTTQIVIRDRGTGISIDTFKRMCNVGTSTSGSKQAQAEIESMPNWLRPTAGFGVGLQSIFLIADQFEIRTGTGTESYFAVVHANRFGGHLQLQKALSHIPRGTTIRICFRLPENFSFSMSGDTDKYLEFHFDPMASVDHTGEARLLEAIRKNCIESMFPLHVTCAENSLEQLDQMELLPICNSDLARKWNDWNERYKVFLSNDCSELQIWDTQTATYGYFHIFPTGNYAQQFLFKGIRVDKKTPHLNISGLSFYLDTYGLGTKETITLDRTSMTSEGRKQFLQIFDELVQIYKECVLECLCNGPLEWRQEICQRGKFIPYTFWLLCDSKQRRRFPEDILNQITDIATVFSKDENGEFVQKSISVRKLIPSLLNVNYINLNRFENHIGLRSYKYDEIHSLLNHAELDDSCVIADSILTKLSSYFLASSIKLLIPGQSLFLYTITDQDNILLSVDSYTKSELLKGLSDYIPWLDYNGYFRHESTAKRYAIPAFTEFNMLAVNRLPYGIARPHNFHCYYIIAPFHREDAQVRSELSATGFIDKIIQSEIFSTVVDYVMQNSICPESASPKLITDAYKRLIKDYYDVMQETSLPH